MWVNKYTRWLSGFFFYSTACCYTCRYWSLSGAVFCARETVYKDRLRLSGFQTVAVFLCAKEKQVESSYSVVAGMLHVFFKVLYLSLDNQACIRSCGWLLWTKWFGWTWLRVVRGALACRRSQVWIPAVTASLFVLTSCWQREVAVWVSAHCGCLSAVLPR
jgi:hypothetical protein